MPSRQVILRLAGTWAQVWATLKAGKGIHGSFYRK